MPTIRRRRTTTPVEPEAKPPEPQSAADKRDADEALRSAGIVETAHEQKAFAGPMPVLNDGFRRIEERVFDLPNPDAEYESLEGALSVGSRDTDDLARALDEAEDCARRAHRLYANAKLDLARFQADAEVIEGAIRTEAAAELQRERDSGLRTKQITDADVTAKAAALFPDEWRDLAARKVRAKLAVEHMERFADLWVSRCRSLGGLLASRR